jgi:hypothetical protein
MHLALEVLLHPEDVHCSKTVVMFLRSARMLGRNMAGFTDLLRNTFSRQTMTSLLTLRRWRVTLRLSWSYKSSGIFLIVKVAMGSSPREDRRIEPEWKLTISDRAGQGRETGLKPAVRRDRALVSIRNTF